MRSMSGIVTKGYPMKRSLYWVLFNPIKGGGGLNLSKMYFPLSHPNRKPLSGSVARD